ncbi:MAG: hypothetical protein U0637_11780 [Phycisphaerales bacterium]
MHGMLTVICGPMFAGKSTQLIERVRGARDLGLQTVVVKPSRDDRYDAARVVTHNGATLDAVAVRGVDEIQSAVRGVPPGALFLAVDEAHFFGDSLVPLVHRLVNTGARVLVVGVERDHRGRPFAPFPELLVEADEVIKMTSTCARCGGRAVHSQRMFGDDAHIVVGGAGMYEARCRSCFEGRS